MKWVWLACKRTFDFSGRSQRKEYWYFTLFQFVMLIFMIVIDIMSNQLFEHNELGLGLFSLSFLVLTLVSSLSVTVRRLHDIDVTGRGVFVNLIPYIGTIGLWVLLCQKGTVGENKYGKDPLASF